MDFYPARQQETSQGNDKDTGPRFNQTGLLFPSHLPSMSRLHSEAQIKVFFLLEAVSNYLTAYCLF